MSGGGSKSWVPASLVGNLSAQSPVSALAVKNILKE